MNEENSLLKALDTTVLSRRSFLKWSSALGGAAVLSGELNLGLKKVEAAAVATNLQADVTVVPSGCSHNCGGRCVLKAWVKDGSIIRITTDDRPDSTSDPQLRACPRGRSYRQRVYNPDRLKYPMKRVGNRGEGKFERISWDEATTLIANEMKRIKEKYGPTAFYNHYASGGATLFAGRRMADRLLHLFGGKLNYYGNYSNHCILYVTPRVFGTGAVMCNTRDDWKNAKLMLFIGFNPAEMIFGTNTHYYIKQARQQGTKVILLDPRYSLTAQSLVDEWIPIRPGTDNALFDAMAYVMINENLQDQAFLDKYTLGFDEEHLPKDVPAGNSYKNYVLGKSDGVPKTPEWAETYTQIPARRIVQLAREVALTKPAMIMHGYGVNRRAYGELAIMGANMIAAMTGNLGKPGAGVGTTTQSRTVVGALPTPANPVAESISVFTWTDAIVRGTEMGPADGVTLLPAGQKTLKTNIKALFNIGGNTLINQHADINKTDKILRDTSLCELIVVADQVMTPSAKYADVLLPVVTWFEMDDLCTNWGPGDSLISMSKAIEPLYECKSDYDIFAMIADKLGLRDKFTEGKTGLQWIQQMVSDSQKADPNFPTFDEWRKKGVYIFKSDPRIPLKTFIDDPVKNALKTPTGKIELFSTTIWNEQKTGFVDAKLMPAIPKFQPEWEGGPWDELYKKYPLQAFGHHYQPRSHSTYEEVDWLREAFPQRVFMNPIDAQARRLKDGDKVRVFNDRGQMMLPVRVTPRIIPGVVDIPQGAWWTPDSNKVDQRGCMNVLTNYRPTPGSRGNPQHSNLVQVEKA